MEKIDELDRKILKIITKSARTPFKEVADQCGVSRAAVHQRVQKMFDNGVITGSSYHVEPDALGYHLCVSALRLYWYHDGESIDVQSGDYRTQANPRSSGGSVHAGCVWNPCQGVCA